ncbi:flagellar hook protein FlgE [Aureimonas psammosilenae]|uniref:flagellar hook protein FlgE n=1 Tax=Aureimonas psammosilenae TaxID=2495496 RepID=UPI00126102E1|nr:flagellar hook protein FlgE [Aureimonas psammosilenae]
MSIGNIMRTSTSGMSAQASKLSVVSENVANSDTNGYKRSETQFSSLITAQSGSGYTSGAVAAVTRNTISMSGNLARTGNSTTTQKLDLAVNGDGFYVVSDGRENLLTRAGSFTMQPDGTMVNAAGYTLKGYPVGANGTDAVLNGFAGLQDVNLKAGLLQANPTTKGVLTVPLDQAFTTGTKAAFTQTALFSVTGTASSNLDTDELRFTVSVDGGAGKDVVVKKAGGLGNIKASDVVSAINSTAGLSGVASVDSAGKIVLKSNGTVTGTGSTIAMTAPTMVTPPSTAITGLTIAGLSVVATTDAGAKGKLAADPAANGSVLPSATATTAISMTVYNNAGEPVKLDVYYTKTNDATNEWSMAVFDSRDASKGTATSPFPYSTSPLAKAKLTFDSTNGYKLGSITPSTGTGQLDNKTLVIDLGPIGGGNFNLDIGNTTQLFKPDASALDASVDGNPPEVVKTINVGEDGVVTAQFTSGSSRSLYKIPVAKVASPDSLTAVSGNAYQAGVASGTVLMGTGGENGFGKVTAGALEESNVDLASELTDMITAQRSYTANSKVFQTGSEILDVLVNLKR